MTAVIMSSARLRLAIGLAVALTFAGCGGADPNKPKLGRVSGKVTYKGQPLTSGTVTFSPEAGKGGETGQVATGPISSNGSYELTTFNTGDGAILGQHIITVQTSQVDGDSLGKPKADGTFSYTVPKSLVPSKYVAVDKSPLRFTVVEGKASYDVELKD